MELIKSALTHKVIPGDAPSPGKHPAIFLLHGRGSNEEDLLGLAPFLDPRFFLIAVRAPFPFAYGGFTWYDMPAPGSQDPGQFRESYERLGQFMSDAKTQYPIDSNRIVLLGFSMGTVMAYAMALTNPRSIHAVAANSGRIPEEMELVYQWNALKGMSFFVSHGVHDPVIGIEAARRAKELLSKTGAELTYREYPMGHSMSEESVDDLAHWLRERLD